MPTPNDVIAFALKASQTRMHTYIDDLKPDEFAKQPYPGVNSVAWMLGHLALTDRKFAAMLGATLPPLPDGFEAKFQTTKKPAEVQTGLGDPKELVAVFDAHRNLLVDAVSRATPEALDAPWPTPHPLWKTVGEACVFMAVHVGLHAGQVTILRRAFGYPPVS